MIDEGIRLTLLLPLLIGSTQSELSLLEFYSIKDLGSVSLSVGGCISA